MKEEMESSTPTNEERKFGRCENMERKTRKTREDGKKMRRRGGEDEKKKMRTRRR